LIGVVLWWDGSVRLSGRWISCLLNVLALSRWRRIVVVIDARTTHGRQSKKLKRAIETGERRESAVLLLSQPINKLHEQCDIETPSGMEKKLVFVSDW
jgi:hypothetical protein